MKRVGTLCALLVLWVATSASLAEAQFRPISESNASEEEFVPPRLLDSCRVMPQYPDAEREAGIEGEVQLEVEVKADGGVGTIEVKKAVEGHPAFSTAAIAAVRQWCFEPARKHGRPVAISVVIPVRFNLDGKHK